MRSIVLAAGALCAAAVARASPTPPTGGNHPQKQYQCHSSVVDVAVDNVTTVVPFLPPIEDQYQAVYYANLLVDRNPAPMTPNLTTLSKTFQIWVEWCSPTNPGPEASTLHLLSHGLGFNASYWDFSLPGSGDDRYSYVAAATAHGYSTLSWNRLGHPPSTVADPYSEIQTLVEVDILASLTRMARAGQIAGISSSPPPTKVVHVGHSYGSQLTMGLAALSPELSDGVVLTGLSGLTEWIGYFVSSASFHLANQNQPARFGKLSNGFLTWGSARENQYAFLAYPDFDPAVLEYAETTKHPFALGNFLSMAVLPVAAPAFSGPVLWLASEHDLFTCGFNCTGLFGDDSPAVRSFNGSSAVETYVQPGAGHALNLHLNASDAYGVVMDWARRHL